MDNDFRHFQRQFGGYLRDPSHVACPAGIPGRRAAIYSELVFNNVSGFLDTCFPVCRSVLGESGWRRLNRTFLRDWPMRTPWFREIPREFVGYLNTSSIATPLPAWLADLAHYEWLELAVDIADTPETETEPAGNLLDRSVVLNPTLHPFSSRWPVHRIGPQWRPHRPQETHLVIYRDSAGAVRFSEINAVTKRLLQLLSEPGATGRASIARIGRELNHADPVRLLEFGHALLRELCHQGILVGAKT